LHISSITKKGDKSITPLACWEAFKSIIDSFNSTVVLVKNRKKLN